MDDVVLAMVGVESLRSPEGANAPSDGLGLDTDEIADHGFVAFDGGSEPSQTCAFLAGERADGYYGVWTHDQEVDRIATRLADRYE